MNKTTAEKKQSLAEEIKKVFFYLFFLERVLERKKK